MARAKAKKSILGHVGARIAHRRKEVDMSQNRLAEMLNVAVDEVRLLEGGGSNPSATRLWEVANLLDVSPGYFFEDAPAATQTPGVRLMPEARQLIRGFYDATQEKRDEALALLVGKKRRQR